jgi:hypothetical protein
VCTGGSGDTDGGGTGGNQQSGGAFGSGGSSSTPTAEPFWPDLPVADFAPPACGTDVEFVHGLNPATPVDYVSLRVASTFGDPALGTVIDSVGTECKSAPDGGSCEASVATLAEDFRNDGGVTESCGGPPYPCQHFLLTTTGDDARTWLPGAGYRDFLGPIDTPAEAILVVASETYYGYGVNCGDPTVRAVSDGYEVVATQMVQDCAPIVQDRVLFHVDSDGTVKELRRNVSSVSSACVGRRAAGLVSSPTPADSELGDFFSRIAHLEAASVGAFEQLRAELLAHGATPELLSAAERARADEVRHAKITGALARKFGAEPAAARVEARPLRSLEEIADENAVEGCVRETFGALFATYQARTATDPDVAREIAAIAEDETRHAALAWNVAVWAGARLSKPANERVRRAQVRAIAELRRELDVDVPESLRTIAGVPDREAAKGLLDGLERALFS